MTLEWQPPSEVVYDFLPKTEKRGWSDNDISGYKYVADGGEHRQVLPVEQPPPVPNKFPSIWKLVIGDMIDRDALGRQRYGTPLQPHNGRDALRDAYEEALDLAVYLRQALYERDNPL